MKIALPIGHSILKNGEITSADGISKGGVNEYKWCKIFVPILANTFKKYGAKADVIQCPERIFDTAYEEKTYKLSKINRKGYDLVIESHINCFNGIAKGTETLYFSEKGKAIAQKVNDKLDDLFTDRGIKQRKDLYILSQTDCTAILNEYFFCDNREEYLKSDTKEEMQIIANKVVGAVLGIKIEEDNNKEEIYMNKIVTYFGDADVFAAVIVAQKHQCPMIKRSDFDNSGLKAKEVIQVGGNKEDKDRFASMKNACKYL